MSNAVRGLVSKKKTRFQEDGFDLDLTYITPRIIAMGFPSEGAEAVYRNRLSDVQRFFTKRHPGGKFKIYNLCSERKYEAKHFGGASNCAHYPFDDHNPSPFITIRDCCNDIEAYLKADPANVVAIHCKAGKGRTGMMIASLLMHIGEQKTAAEALDAFGRKRTSNNKGVTIPSQIRWVYQYESYLKKHHFPKVPFNFKGPLVRITQFRVGPCPDFDTGGGCDPYFKVTTMDGKEIYNHKKAKGTKVTAWKSTEPLRDFHVNIPVQGEFHVVFYDQDALSKDDKMFGFWLHTAYVEPSVVLSKNEIDGAIKDKKHHAFRANFQCEIIFGDVSESKDRDHISATIRASAAAAAAAGGDDEDDEDDDDEFELPTKAPAKGAPAKAPAKAPSAAPAKGAPVPAKAPAKAPAKGAAPPPPADDDIPPPPEDPDA